MGIRHEPYTKVLNLIFLIKFKIATVNPRKIMVSIDKITSALEVLEKTMVENINLVHSNLMDDIQKDLNKIVQRSIQTVECLEDVFQKSLLEFGEEMMPNSAIEKIKNSNELQK